LQFNDSLITNQIYQLTIVGPSSEYAEYNLHAETPPSPNYYSTTDKVIGELIITHHNFNKAILNGTFWFDAINSNGEIVQVREGRFDVHY
jgi:hypothetical protein